MPVIANSHATRSLKALTRPPSSLSSSLLQAHNLVERPELPQGAALNGLYSLINLLISGNMISLLQYIIEFAKCQL